MVQFLPNRDGIQRTVDSPDFASPEDAYAELRRREAANGWTGGGVFRSSASYAPVKLVEPPRVSMDELRQRLRSAHARLEMAKRAWLAADESVKKAADLVTQARAEAERFNILDAEIAAHFASQIRSGVDFAMLPDLAAKTEQKAMAERRVGDLEAAHAQLKQEAREAHAALTAASTAVDLAVTAVVGETAEQDADTLESARATVAALTEKISGVGMAMHLYEDGHPTPMPLSARLKRVLNSTGAQVRGDPRWRDFATRLKTDSAAGFDPPKSDAEAKAKAE